MSYFTVQKLCAGYAGAPIIRNLSFSISSGKLLGILGANGSGKTTLLKALCGIHSHDGTCSLEGTLLDDMSARQIARLVSYIPQRSGISIDISVLDVVLMGFNPQLHLLEYPNDSMRRQAIRALETVGLLSRAHDNYLHLSEGQKQLCILARTLVTDSRLLLLDEPESALDFRFRYRMLQTIRSWLQNASRCAIVTLHDPTLALNYCDELLLLKDGQSIGLLHPGEDSCERMSALLSVIYGSVTVTACCDKTGKQHLVMLKEEDASV